MVDETPGNRFGSIRRFEAAVIRRASVVGWIILVALIATAVNRELILDARFLGSAAGMALATAIGTLTPWRKILDDRIGQWLIWAWAAATVALLGAFSLFPQLEQAVLPLFAGVVLMTGLVLDPLKQTTMTLFVVLVMIATAGDRAPVDFAISVFTVLVVAVGAGYAHSEYRRTIAAGSETMVELEEQRRSFERLFEVSATVARADSLEEVLPELVGTICRYLGGDVGLVFLYRPESHTLQVLSPIWVNTHPLDVGDISVPISGSGVISQIFRSGKAIRADAIASNPDAFSVLGELGIGEALLAPLKVEGINVGVIAVGDPISGHFEPDQAQELADIGAGAALVLSQIGRYQAAAEMSRRLEEVARMKTDFVSVVSHELRTPLTSIIGSLDTVARPELAPESAVARELLGSARRQAGRLQRLIEDLLMVSRLERDAVPLQIEPVAIADLVDDVRRLVPGVEPLGVEIGGFDLAVKADHDHLGRVLINLLDNASKYADGSPVEIVAGAVQGGTHVAISVIDHGPGIPSHMRESVFDRFTQLEHAATRTRGGTGLGLSIVKGLIEAMGGSVELSETDGGGSTFTVVLPMAPLPVGRHEMKAL